METIIRIEYTKGVTAIEAQRLVQSLVHSPVRLAQESHLLLWITSSNFEGIVMRRSVYYDNLFVEPILSKKTV